MVEWDRLMAFSCWLILLFVFLFSMLLLFFVPKCEMAFFVYVTFCYAMIPESWQMSDRKEPRVGKKKEVLLHRAKMIMKCEERLIQ